MPFSPIDSLDPHHNPFVLDKTKQKQNANQAVGVLAAAPSKLTVRAALAQGNLNLDPHTGRPRPQFEISTRQIIALIVRYRFRSMSYEQLKNLPLSQLNTQEKEFVAYLRANPNIFDTIAKLDKEPGISTEDIKLASQLAADPLVLTDHDLQNLHQSTPAPSTFQPEPDEFLANARGLNTQDLINTLQQINPQGLTFDELMNLKADQLGLREREMQSLRFLQSPTVSNVLQRLATPYDNMISPEVLRVLSSLLWNPSIYGTTPIVFFQTAPLAHETDIDPVVNLGGQNPTGKVGKVYKRTRSNGKVDQPKQVVHLEASRVIDICQRISSNGQVTMAELRNYIPQNEPEERALNLLRQAHIFRAIAGMKHEPDYLSREDVQLALAEGALVLNEPFIVVIVEP